MKAVHLLTASTGVLAFGAMTMATTILSQGFEESPFTNGTEITNAEMVGDDESVGGGWVFNGDFRPPNVTTDQAYSGTQSLRLRRPTTGDSSFLYGQNTSVSVTSGIVETSFYAYWVAGTSSVEFRLGTNLSTGVPTGNPGGSIGSGGGAITFYTGTGGVQAGDVTETGWYGVKLVTDFDTSTFDVYLDSGDGFTLIASDLSAGPLNNDAGNAISFKQRGGGNGYFYLDDVSIIAVPEPATMGVLALGGGALMLARKRKRAE